MQPEQLKPPAEWNTALATQGWAFAGTNHTLIFFERPGYWLRVWRNTAFCWQASVMPEEFRVPRQELGVAGCWLRFPEEDQAPAVRGKGAQARAMATARALMVEHTAYLAELGIELTCVGVKLFKGSGAGGMVTTKVFRANDINDQIT